jgi:hypothetical protein
VVHVGVVSEDEHCGSRRCRGRRGRTEPNRRCVRLGVGERRLDGAARRARVRPA